MNMRVTGSVIAGVIGGAIIGMTLGYFAGNTPIGLVICAAIGALAGLVWERMDRRRLEKIRPQRGSPQPSQVMPPEHDGSAHRRAAGELPGKQ